VRGINGADQSADLGLRCELAKNLLNSLASLRCTTSLALEKDDAFVAFNSDIVNLDPQAKALLDMIALAGRIPFSELTPSLARAQFVELCRRTRKSADWPVTTSDHTIPGPGGSIKTRLFRPRSAAVGTPPVLLFFHGGGFCIGDIDTHDPVCRQLAEEARCAVLAVDYRLAPEHRFPAAVDDSYAALQFISAEGASLGVDPNRIAVGGDSAGGNLAAVSAISARDTGITLVGQLLIYPAVDWVTAYQSREDYGEGFLLTEEAIGWFGRNYIDAGQHNDWRASPIFASDLSGLAPALVICGECDPLLGESRAYSEKLRQSGNDVHFHLYPGMIHGFLTMGGMIAAADDAIAQSAEFLASVFHSSQSLPDDTELR
jgi:acetyl esterase